MQPVVNFLNQCVQRFGCNTQERLLQLQQQVTDLQEAADRFMQSERCAGASSIVNNLRNLERQAHCCCYNCIICAW